MKRETGKRVWGFGMKKSAVGAAVVLVALLGAVGGTAAEGAGDTQTHSLPKQSGQVQFRDIEQHWGKSAILAAAQKGYVSGYTDGTFQPNKSVTRAEFASMLVAAMELPLAEKQPTDKWYGPATTAAIQAGLTTFDEFKGNWTTEMTREEMARFAVRATGVENSDAKKWMYLVTQAGIMSGVGKGELAADKTTTRAEAVAVIEKTLQVKSGKTLKADKYAVGAAEIYWHKTNIYTVMPEFFNDEFKNSMWDESQLDLKTPDGKFHGVIDEVIAIDLADPNDPNLPKVPNYKELKWNTVDQEGISIYKHPDSYLLVYRSHVVFNKDKRKYGNTMDLYISGSSWPNINGSFPGMEEFQNGVLNHTANVFAKKTSDSNAFLIPKKGLLTDGTFELWAIVPCIEDIHNIIVKSKVPKKI